LKQEYLSDIELYFTTNVTGNTLEFFGDEFKHITKVMRHSVGDVLHATDGIGNYYETIIDSVSSNSVVSTISKSEKYNNELENIVFCFPRLKSNDRFEFELEKAIELGITNFIIINTERTIPKGEKLDRWNKIALAAMKQSLRTYIPSIKYYKSLNIVNELNGTNLLFDQNGDESLLQYIKNNDMYESNSLNYFIFGPEGGLSKNEINSIKESKILKLTKNRLRAETAVIVAASIVSTKL
jgi:16S rRNA (uracil1498-N3)-methyltransferase